MLLKTKGVVLKSIRYGERSIISQVLSREKGLISVISSKNKKQANYFQALELIDFICYYSKNKQIHRTKEVFLNSHTANKKNEIAVNAIRFFLAEFLHAIIREEETNYPLFDYIASELIKLHSTSLQLQDFHLQFIVNLTRFIGIYPNISEHDNFFDLEEGTGCQTRPRQSNFIEKEKLCLFKKAFSNDTNISKSERSKLLDLLVSYYDTQLACNLAKLKSKSVLELVFN